MWLPKEKRNTNSCCISSEPIKRKTTKKSTILLFFDFKAAFDSVDFEILLNKAKNYLSEQEINAIKWYLSQVHLKIGNHLIPQNKGVPQGGILSPFLWLIFIDDLIALLALNHGQNNVFAYADDLLILVKSIPEASKTVQTVKEWATKNKIQVNLKKGKSAFLRLSKGPQDVVTNSIQGVLYQSEYKYLGFNFSSSLNCNKHLKEFANSLAWTKAKTKLTMAKVSLKDKAKFWNTYLYSKLSYRLAALYFLNKSSCKKIVDKFYKNLKQSLGLSKSTNREKINQILNVKDPLTIMHNTLNRLHEKAPNQIPKTLNRSTEASNFKIDNDAIILTYLKNFDWLGHIGIKCRCGNFKITAKDSINCEILKKTTSNTQIIPQIKKALSENNIEDLSKISEDKHATPVFEFLVKMQQDAQKKYIYEKNTSKKTREDSSQRKPTLKSTRN